MDIAMSFGHHPMVVQSAALTAAARAHEFVSQSSKLLLIVMHRLHRHTFVHQQTNHIRAHTHM